MSYNMEEARSMGYVTDTMAEMMQSPVFAVGIRTAALNAAVQTNTVVSEMVSVAQKFEEYLLNGYINDPA